MHSPHARRRHRWPILASLFLASGGCWPAFDALQADGEPDASLAADASAADAARSGGPSPRDGASCSGDDEGVSSEASTSAYAAAVLADGPLAYWRLDDAPGKAALDSTGNGHGGAFQGGVTLGVPGALADPADRAANFDGTTASLLIGLGVAVGGEGTATGSFTYELWFRPTQLAAGARILSREYLDTDAASSSNGTEIAISGTDAGGVSGFMFRQYAGGNVERMVASTQLPSTTTFTYAVVVYDSLQKGLTLYVDGAVVDSNHPNLTQGYIPAVAELSWGATSIPLESFFAGDLDELAVYDKALTVAQVQAHYFAARSP